MANEAKHGFWVGIRPCGCVTAAHATGHGVTDADIAQFRAEMAASGRTVEYRELTHDEFMATFKPCTCAVGPNKH